MRRSAWASRRPRRRARPACRVAGPRRSTAAGRSSERRTSSSSPDLGRDDMQRELVIGMLLLLLAAPAGAQVISGGGDTIVHGGSGGVSPVPVKTIFGFRIVKDGDKVSGTFDCLALAPGAATGPGSGQFTENIM